jgi:hypothetical protein
MSDETLAANKYVEHFNRVVSNYTEAIVEGDRERHDRAASALDVLMREYAQATELLDHVNGECWQRIEAEHQRGGDFAATASELGTRFPPIASELLDFAEDIAGGGETA